MARRDHGIDVNTVVTVGAVAAVLYVIYQVVQGLKKAGGAAGQAISAAGSAAYKAASVVTAPASDAIFAIWEVLNPMPAMSAKGNVLWPDGTYTPLSQLTVRTDKLDNVYVLDPNGLIYQLQPSDINGDFPASEITDASQIGKSPQ